jgi:Tfp pilus assembly protein PilF
LTYEKLQDFGKAKAELGKAINLDPKSPVADQARKAISEITAS